MRQVFARATLVVFVVLLSLAVVEKALRVVGYEYRPMSVKIGTTTDARYFHLFGDQHFIYDPELIWRPKPGYEIFNHQGFRGPEMTPEPESGVLRVVAIGDSNTLGWAGADGSNWPAALGRAMEGARLPAEVVNGGVWGYSSFQGVRRMREALQYRPDIVLVSYGSNDAHRVHRPDREFARKSKWFR
ncbi:MAG: GDSL-type esterase/lipase family protein, partial [Acidobacteriota bacterium]|nr:GDSL-type esterase/lipase family protein [Acidobacteriota bacterium]